MEVAKARYTGSMRHQTHRIPSGGQIIFGRTPENPDRDWKSLDSIEDAQFLESKGNVEVEWNPAGKLKSAANSTGDALKEWSYKQKQRLIGDLDLDIAGNAPEEEMDEELQAILDDIENGGL